MELTAWLSLATVCVMGAVSPGPSLAVVVRNVVGGTRRHGMMTATGHGLGVGFYALLTVLGLAVVVTHTPWLFNGLRYGGALLLGYWGIRSLLGQGSGPLHLDAGQRLTFSPSHAFQQGFLVAFMNPKLALFFTALFSQFVDARAGWGSKAVMTLTAGGIDMLWYLAVVVLVSRSRVLSLLRGNARGIERISGVVLILLAIRVLW